MTTDPFTEAARKRAEQIVPLDGGEPNPIFRDRRELVEMAEWARTHLAAQEPTDAEAQAYLAAFSEDLPPDTTWTPDTIDRVKRGLRAARRDEEAR